MIPYCTRWMPKRNLEQIAVFCTKCEKLMYKINNQYMRHYILSGGYFDYVASTTYEPTDAPNWKKCPYCGVVIENEK